MVSITLRHIVALAVLLCPIAAHAAAAPASFQGRLTIPRVRQPPPLSGPLTAAWAHAAKAPIAFDTRTRRLDPHPAVAYLEIFAGDLYVAFVVPQSEPITAQARQNDAGLGNDDAVIVYLYPGGPSGFVYAFVSNPIGTHSSYSSENTAFAPAWKTTGLVTKHGYTVYMRIPLDTMKGARGNVWRANFRRIVSRTLDDYDWSYNASTMAGSDPQPITAGRLAGFPRVAAMWPKPRIGIYALGAIAARSIGGSTSRLGADLSIPITRTASFVSTIHPDYSNVEIDQQTISPTAFPRYYSDVRPFFTQLQNYYNPFTCYGCTGVTPLYTTSIPTPRYGNAIEGKQGPFSFAAFDAVGAQREDNAEVATYQSRDQKFSAGLQHVAASLPGLLDTTSTEAASYDSQRGFNAFAAGSQESGSLVTQPGAAQWTEAGMSTYDKTSSAGITWQRIGAQFSPFDGYVPNNGIAGYAANVGKTWFRSSKATVPRVLFYAETDEFRKPDGTVGQSDDQLAFGADLQHVLGLSQLMHVRAQIGSSFLRLPDGNLVSVSQNGIDFTYGYRTATQQFISFYTGRFGPGTLDYWTRQFNFRLARSVTLSLEADDGDQRLDDGTRNKQWLERASVVWQHAKDESFSLGVRRIIGSSPVLDFAQLPAPYFSAWNLSAEFYKRLPHDELYVVYGDPSQLTTAPSFIVKLIHYVGAQKGV